MTSGNSLRDEIKDAIAGALMGQQIAPDSADYELAACIADEVFSVMGISEGIQDMPIKEAIRCYKSKPEEGHYCDGCKHLGENTCMGRSSATHPFCWEDNQ